MDSFFARSALTALWLSGVVMGVCLFFIGYAQMSLSGSFADAPGMMGQAASAFPGTDRVVMDTPAMGTTGVILMAIGGMLAVFTATGLYRVLRAPIRRPGNVLSDTTEGRIGACAIFGGGALVGLYGIYTKGWPAAQSLFSQFTKVSKLSFEDVTSPSISGVADSITVIPNLVTCLALAWMVSAGLNGFVVNFTDNER